MSEVSKVAKPASGQASHPAPEEEEQIFLGYCRDLAGLKPDGRVLEIGCGWGPLAKALEGFLSDQGSYHGIDVVEEKVQRCSLLCPSPNFSFKRVDVFNRNYNSESKTAASRFRFPFKDDSFDLVILRSVFTVMTAEEAHPYLSEIARVLVKGGRCLITFFLLNPESQALLASNKIREFNYCWGVCSTEAAGGNHAVAYDEAYVKVAFAINGLVPSEPIYYGHWCGRQSNWYSQDMVIARKV
jgi:SAM-dependent methyltransferase